jgi:Integral peroxisomal membrane peroxin
VARGTQPQQRDEGLRHRHTTSFTAVMDTSGLQIIEDYAAQQKHAAEAAAAAAAAAAGTTGALPSVPESLSPPLLPTAVATLVAAEATSNSSSSPLGSSPAVSGGSPPLLHFAPSPSPVLGDKGRDTAAPLEPPEAAAAAAGDDVAPPDMATASTLPDAAASHQPLPGVGSAPGDSLRHTTPAGLARRSAQGVTWGLSPAPPSSGGSMMPPHTSSFTAVGGALLRTMDAASAPPTLARRSAGPMLFGSAGSAAAGGVAALSPLRPASASPLRDFALAGGNSGAMTPQQPRSRSPLPVPGEELEDEVLVEVFENERAQPFRGWGHTWPGHFLPSDRVGHWSDRDGAPGGPQSMLFDRVAPRLPRGWKWLDEEWTVDLEGLQDEACDAEGWCYGMDFSWMEWPPAPGMGRATIKSFVRRRRWVRARMRVTLADATEVMGDEGRSAADARRPGGGGGVITVSSGRGEDYGGDADADADSGGGAPGGHLPPMRPPPRPPGADASNGGVAALMVPAGVFGAAAAAGLGLTGAADGAAVAAAAASAVVSRIVRAVSSDLPPENRAHARQGDAMSADSLPPTLLPPAPVPVCDSSAPGLNDGAASSQVHGRGEADDDGGHDDDDDDSSSVDSDAPPQRPFFRPLPQAVGLPDSSSSSSGRALRALDSSDDDEGADSSGNDKEASPSNACWTEGTSDAAAPTDTPKPALAAAQAQNGGGGIAGATTGAAAQTQAAVTATAGIQTADAAGHHDGAVLAAAAHEPAATLSIGAVPVAATPAAAAPGLSDRAQQLGGTPSGASDVAAAQASSSNAAAAQASSSDVAAAQAGSSDVAAAQASSGSASGDDWVWRSAEAAATNAGTAAEHGVLSAAQSQQQVAEALVPAAAADGTAAVAATTTTAATAGTYADTTVQTAAPLPADSPHTAPLVPPVAQQPLASAVAAAADPGGCAAAGKTPRERSSSGASTAPALSTARTGRRGRTRSGSGSGNASGRAGRGRLGAVSLRASGALSPGVLSPRTSSGAEDALSAAARAAADFDAADNVRKGGLALVSGDDAESAATAAQPAEVAAATSLGCAAHPQQRVGDGQEQGQELSKQQQEDEGQQQQR